MADVYESNGSWTIERLRGTDSSFLDGAGRPAAPAQPIAIATGPKIQNIGTVGASNFWITTQSIAKNDEILWVVVADGLVGGGRASAGIDQISWWPIGDHSDGDAIYGPTLGPSQVIGNLAASGGNFRSQYAGDPANNPRGTWIPLNPELTDGGFSSLVALTANAGGSAAAGDLQVDMTGCKMIGFPVNFWNTGQLWAPNAFRGS